MKTEGIAVRMGGVQLFVGKICIAPHHPQISDLRGALIFYREGPYSDQYSTAYDAISLDREVADYAIRKGVSMFVFYATDTRELFLAHEEDVENSPVGDLGMAEQYRIPMNRMGKLKDALGVATVYTQNITLLNSRKPEIPLGNPEQRSLFQT